MPLAEPVKDGMRLALQERFDPLCAVPQLDVAIVAYVPVMVLPSALRVPFKVMVWDPAVAVSVTL